MEFRSVELEEMRSETSESETNSSLFASIVYRTAIDAKETNDFSTVDLSIRFPHSNCLEFRRRTEWSFRRDSSLRLRSVSSSTSTIASAMFAPIISVGSWEEEIPARDSNTTDADADFRRRASRETDRPDRSEIHRLRKFFAPLRSAVRVLLRLCVVRVRPLPL